MDAEAAALSAAFKAFEPDIDAEAAALTEYNKAFVSVAAFPPVTFIVPFTDKFVPSNVNLSLRENCPLLSKYTDVFELLYAPEYSVSPPGIAPPINIFLGVCLASK